MPPRQLRTWTAALLVPTLLAVGLGLRSFHYGRDRAVWQDEAGLLLTVTARGFHDLFHGRLDYHQAAPPLYLCVLKGISLILGDGSHALRLPSFLASCAALLLFVPVARRLLAARAAPWAVLLFAVSEQMLWHASEAKAYSVDVLAATIVLAVPCWGRLHSPARQALAYALIAPLLLLSSYPACFLFAGVLIAYFPAVCLRKQARTWMAYAALAATTTATLLWLVHGPIRNQHDSEIQSCWVACMPDWQRPWTVPGWLLLSPFEVGRYACKPMGQVLVFLAVPGALVLWRRGERIEVLRLTMPIVLALVAACAHRYPFGGARVMAYATPAVLLLGAAGVPPLLDWLRRDFLVWRAGGVRSLIRATNFLASGGCKPPDASEKSGGLHPPLAKKLVLLNEIGVYPRANAPRSPTLIRDVNACGRLLSAALIVVLVLPLMSSLGQVVRPWREAGIPDAAEYVRARQHEGDRILGNDVAQQYYFRGLGSAFHLLDESPLPPAPVGRLWVVMTASLPQEERVRLASHLAPPGWTARRQTEFAYTTILLFSNGSPSSIHLPAPSARCYGGASLSYLDRDSPRRTIAHAP